MTGNVTFFVTTGRSGTQWLAAALDTCFHDLATTTHEPLGPRYRPREFLRAYHRASAMAAVEEISMHLDDVERILKTRDYIEVGWPGGVAVPLLFDRFGSSLRLVHLVRHPVYTAMSIATHRFFQQERQDEYVRLAQLDPFIAGVVQKEYANRWPSMTAYEKCLFLWTEMHLYAEELAEVFPSVPMIRVLAEGLFSGESDSTDPLTDFLGLPRRADFRDQAPIHVDAYREQSKRVAAWTLILEHENTIALSRRLGYRLDSVTQHELESRYRSD